MFTFLFFETRAKYLPGGYSWYFHTYISRLGQFLGSTFWISVYFGIFRKMNIFWGMKILWIFFGGRHKIGLYLGVISMHFRVFSSGQVTEWRIFLGLLKFQIFFGGCLKLGWTVDAGPEPTYKEKMRVPSLGSTSPVNHAFWRLFSYLLIPKVACIANNMDPDQTTPKGAVRSGLTWLAYMMKSSLKCSWMYAADIKSKHFHGRKMAG